MNHDFEALGLVVWLSRLFFFLIVKPSLYLAAFWVFYYLFTIRMRRQERARFFLDLVEGGIKKGRSIEETIISVSESRDDSMGLQLHILAFHLKNGLSLSPAMERVPKLLAPQVTAIFRAGIQVGDLAKVMPACRQLSKDALSITRSAMNYLVLFVFMGLPINLLLFLCLRIWVFPQLGAVFAQMMPSSIPFSYILMQEYGNAIMAIQLILFLIIWIIAFLYMDGPRTFRWLDKLCSPITQRLPHFLPWRRKRLQRDFATILAILLDSGMPEPEALTLAADCTANKFFKARAQRAVDDLRNGAKLSDAVQVIDDNGEFKWRLTQVMLSPGGGFLKAMAGWNESLDAKAFQQEQAGAQLFTTFIVLLNGVMVGIIAVGVFSMLVALINEGVLW